MKTFTALTALLATANAHMLMRTPTPDRQYQNGPLDAAGSNYPCQFAGGSGTISTSSPNEMAIGGSGQLSFTGGATHGGGSCQVSIAKTLSPNKDTKFMVIKSIEGGCPSDADGNLSNDAAGTGAATFSYTIPADAGLDAGDYTIAWTWNNKIGNREFYMNCGYLKLSAGSGSKKREEYAPRKNMPISKRQSTLPDLFIANIGNGCSTPEGIDVQYPNPGADLTVGSKAKLGSPQGSCGSAGNAASPSTGSSASAPVASSPASAESSNAVAPVPSATGNFGKPAPSASATGNDDPITQSEGGNFATQSAPASQATSAASQATSAVAAIPSTPASTAASVNIPVPTGTGAISNVQTGPCTDEGVWSCASDGSFFQRCASGQWSAKMAMNAGMTCVPGISANFAYNVSGSHAKRDLRNHIARRRNNVHGPALS